jgi:membrane protein YqaA with SNARE-associated domain
MTDVGFVVAAYGVILGGVATYALTLVRRLRIARATSLRIRREAEGAPPIPNSGP